MHRDDDASLAQDRHEARSHDPAGPLRYKVSIRVTCNALAMLAANRYVSRPGTFASYSVTWQTGA